MEQGGRIGADKADGQPLNGSGNVSKLPQILPIRRPDPSENVQKRFARRRTHVCMASPTYMGVQVVILRNLYDYKPQEQGNGSVGAFLSERM